MMTSHAPLFAGTMAHDKPGHYLVHVKDRAGGNSGFILFKRADAPEFVRAACGDNWAVITVIVGLNVQTLEDDIGELDPDEDPSHILQTLATWQAAAETLVHDQRMDTLLPDMIPACRCLTVVLETSQKYNPVYETRYDLLVLAKGEM